MARSVRGHIPLWTGTNKVPRSCGSCGSIFGVSPKAIFLGGSIAIAPAVVPNLSDAQLLPFTPSDGSSRRAGRESATLAFCLPRSRRRSSGGAKAELWSAAWPFFFLVSIFAGDAELGRSRRRCRCYARGCDCEIGRAETAKLWRSCRSNGSLAARHRAPSRRRRREEGGGGGG
ncbi:MAG: hypothetical protein BJ554DRAFT_6146 [Olpidium bornovanus]|uniref:Uncharacterized protein n=1 Tax=Olpidium bornovanus TaxID=278681 RepID=A0A8H8A236_9FUNG|nr:MAG: hypothetical protein BJ554DRAFT_6146 [Olpidium bornovanus]